MTSGVVFVDVVGGAAGDMLLAALLDAGAAEDAVRDNVERVIPGRVRWRTECVRRGGFRARRLVVEAVTGTQRPPGRRRRLSGLAEAVSGADLPPTVADAALRVLGRLAEAERRVHGVGSGDVDVHEIGDDDTLLDVVGVTSALHAMGAGRVVCSSLPLAFGGSAPGRHGHGEVPLPAPVTLELARSFTLRPARAPGERVTPTAAAILAALAEPGPDLPNMTLASVGYGAGTRDPAGWPNLVRVLVGKAAGRDATAPSTTLVVVETNLDDLSPELVASAGESLLAGGALDVWTTPTLMKKGRPGVVVSALCDPSDAHTIRALMFEQTSTLGVRSYEVSREELDRRTEIVVVGGERIRVKVASLDGRVLSAKPEHDDVRAAAATTGRAVRAVAQDAAAAAGAFLVERA